MAIHSAIIAALDERPPVPEPAPQPPPTTRLLSDDSRPGDLFNERASWEESWFTSQGWRVSHRSKEETFWVRPGKDVRDGHSASTGYRGDTDCLYIWSSSTDLPTETPLSKFFVFSHYYFNGDMSKAAKALRQQGYTNEGSTTTLALLRALDFEDIEDGQQEVALPVHRGHDLTDTGNGRRMKEFFGGQFRYNTIESKWYVWRGHAWERDDTLEVHRASERNAEMVLEVYQALVEQARGTDGYKAAFKELHDAKLIFNQGKIVAAIARFSAQPGIAITPGQFDSNLDLLNLPNGTLNLVTGKLHPHDPDNLITLTFGAEYDPDAGCPKFLRFMADILPSTDIQGYVQRALGYTLLGRPAERAMFLLHGPSGTGKSVLTSVMTRVFGGYGITAPATTFRLKKNDTSVDVHRLRGRRFVTTSEMPEGVLLDEELVKRITGGDMITSRSLYEDYQDWKAQCVVWIATNFLPRVNSDDNAIWRRAKSIPMQTEFGKDGLEEILGYADQLVVERNGILNWLLEGLIAYRERGLDQPEEITADIESYRTDVDAVASFIRDRLDEGILVRVDGAEVKSSVLNGLYTRYCEENRMPVLGARRFANRLRALGFTPAKVGGVAMWTGLQYVPDGWHDFLIAPQLQAAGS
jgi:P4 family phage/plasmid primase-like protien